MIYAGTGHRPDKLGGYKDDARLELEKFAERVLRTLEVPATQIISGGAQGWDQALAFAALRLEIPFTLAMPFESQASAWPYEVQMRHRALKKAAARVVVVQPGGFAAWKMQARNVWMVNEAQAVLALWNGTSGGTANCVAYAKASGVPVMNLWERWGK